MILYVAAHKTNEKIYIGWSSQTLEQRRGHHLRNVRQNSSYHFHRALRKHGVDAFEWWVAEEYDTAEQAKQAEIAWIACLKSQGVALYNGTDGGDGFFGGKHSLETKQKMSRDRTGRKLRNVRRGEAAANSRLTREQVDEIRASKLTHKELSVIYGVVGSHICHIKKGNRW